MSDYSIGDLSGDWILRAREGKLELWENTKSGNWGVYLYEHESRGEDWLMHVIRGNKDTARQILATVSGLLV